MPTSLTFKQAEDTTSAAKVIKLTNNFALGAAIEAMAEAFSLVRKFGVLPQVFFDECEGQINAGTDSCRGVELSIFDKDRVSLDLQMLIPLN